MSALINFLAPPLRGERAVRQMTLYLQVSLIALIGAYTVGMLVNDGMAARVIGVFSITTGVIGLVLLRASYLTFIRIITPLIVYLTVSLLVLTGDGVQSTSVPALAVVHVVAALIGGRIVGGLYGLATIATLVAAYILEINGVIDNGLIKPTPLNELINVSTAFAGLMVVLWFLIKNIEQDREHAREQAEELNSAYEQLQAQQARASSTEEQYRLVANNASDMIWTCDMDLTYAFMSPSVRRLTGYDAAGLVGRSAFHVVHPDDIQQFIDLFNEIKQIESLNPGFEQLHRVEFRLLRDDGGYIWAESTIGVMRDSDGEMIGVTGSTRDISERMKMVEQQRAVSHQLRQSQKLESIGQLTGGVAHDINNLLVAIQGYSDLIKDSEKTPERRGYIDEIQKASDRAASLTRQLLTFSRQDNVEKHSVDLHELVSGVQSMLSRLIPESIEIRYQTQPGFHVINGDPGQLEQLIVNLCVNARDAIGDSGKINITLENVSVDAETAGQIPGGQPGAHVKLTIRDDGCGMQREVVDRIFEPFFSTKERGKGTGLGLAVVQGIVLEHRGFIKVDSTPDAGTQISVYLPLSDAVTTDTEQYEMLQGPEGAGQTVLVVEDEEQVRRLVALILSRAGYEVIEAENGAVGLEKYKHHATDIELVLSDIVMPEMSGEDLMLAVRRNSGETPFVFMSGYTENPGFIEDSGAGFVQKPFSATQLVNAVQTSIQESLKPNLS